MIDSIRAATGEDVAAIAAIYAPYVRETAISFEYEAPDEAEMAARLAAVLPVYPWLVAETDGRVAGYAYGSAHGERAAYRRSANAGIYLAQGMHRRGMGRALYAVLLAALKLQGYHAVFGSITLPNPASVGLHKASGFAPVGVCRQVGFKFNVWHDVGWWGLCLEAGGEAQPLLPFTDALLRDAKRIAAGA